VCRKENSIWSSKRKKSKVKEQN